MIERVQPDQQGRRLTLAVPLAIQFAASQVVVLAESFQELKAGPGGKRKENIPLEIGCVDVQVAYPPFRRRGVAIGAFPLLLDARNGAPADEVNVAGPDSPADDDVALRLIVLDAKEVHLRPRSRRSVVSR